MAFVGFEFDKEGLVELEAWAKEKLTEEDQDKLAGILDKMFKFTGAGGIFVEQFDGMLFKTLIKEGVSKIFKE